MATHDHNAHGAQVARQEEVSAVICLGFPLRLSSHGIVVCMRVVWA